MPTKQVPVSRPIPPRAPLVEWAEESPNEYQPGGYLRIRIADRFGQRYRIVRKLGWGHFSTVWLAHDSETSSHVALKVVKSAPRYSQTAADEIALLQHVIDSRNASPIAAEHPGRDRLVTFLDSFKHTNPRSGQSHSCIAFEPLGMNLLQLIQQPEYKHRGIPLPLCKQIARQTLQGLDYLHRVCQLVHTDLKPENILLRIAPSAVEAHIRAELASSPPAVERSVALGGKSHGPNRRNNAVFIIGSQPLPSPSPSADLESSPTNDANVNSNARLSVLDGPSLLSRTAPLSVTPIPLPTPMPSGSEPKEVVSVKIADLGNAVHVGRHVTDDIQTRQYRSPEVILRKPWGTAVDLFSLGCVVFELLTGDFLFEPKSREPLWSRDDDHICQMHEALGPFTREAAQGGVYSKAIFRSDCSLRNVPARKINMWPILSVLRDKYEFNPEAAEEMDSFLRGVLALDPAARASAQEAVEHPWLWS
ncbi:kinase-like protein [Ceratobasidium sp. AG-I]|nr:kinase-like protein [Ceratobasidium sp. AG-I]